jgi:hypothetical protein
VIYNYETSGVSKQIRKAAQNGVRESARLQMSLSRHNNVSVNRHFYTLTGSSISTPVAIQPVITKRFNPAR